MLEVKAGPVEAFSRFGDRLLDSNKALLSSSDHRRFSSRQAVTGIALVKREQADCLSGSATRLRQNGLAKGIGFKQFYRTVQPSAVDPNST
jgi:hypothetical protein